MDKIQKFLKKIHRNDRNRIISVIDALYEKATNHLDIKKIIGTDKYRVRVGDYRIIFFYDEYHDVQIEDIVRRSDTTYN